MRGHEVAAANQIEHHPRRWSVVGFGVGIDPFGWEACLVAAEGLEVGTGPFGWEACPAEEGIGLVECFVVAGHPWRFVGVLREEVHLFGLGPCLVVDGLLLLRRHQSFGRL